MGKGRKQAGRDSQVCPFHNIIQSSLSGGTSFFYVAPNGSLSPRAQTEADAWQLFRVVKLSFRLHPAGTRTGPLAVGYIGGVPDTNPSTVATIMELLPATVLGISTTVPTEWVNVPKKDLAGQIPWYRTVAGTADPIEEQPGAVVLGGTGTDPLILELRGVLEFKVASATANTPLASNLRRLLREERMNRELLRERAVLLKLLGQAATGPAAAIPSITGGV